MLWPMGMSNWSTMRPWPENENLVSFCMCSCYVVLLESRLFEESMAICSCSLDEVVSPLVGPDRRSESERNDEAEVTGTPRSQRRLQQKIIKAEIQYTNSRVYMSVR
jgi:hypothetical protein